MMTMQELANFFGWCSVVNIAFYLFTVTALWLMGGAYSWMVTRIFKVSEEASSDLALNYVANFKVVIIVFNLTPYIALRIMLST